MSGKEKDTANHITAGDGEGIDGMGVPRCNKYPRTKPKVRADLDLLRVG